MNFLKGDHLKLNCVFGTLLNVTYPVYATVKCTLASLFTRYQKNTAIFNWSPRTRIIIMLFHLVLMLRPTWFLLIIFLQGAEINMAVFFWYRVKCDLSRVRYCTVAYTSVTFYNYQNDTAMFIWAPCTWTRCRELTKQAIPIKIPATNVIPDIRSSFWRNISPKK